MSEFEFPQQKFLNCSCLPKTTQDSGKCSFTQVHDVYKRKISL